MSFCMAKVRYNLLDEMNEKIIYHFRLTLGRHWLTQLLFLLLTSLPTTLVTLSTKNYSFFLVRECSEQGSLV